MRTIHTFCLPRASRADRRREQTRRSGFTLIEMLVSISILVILSVIAISAFRGSDKDKITAGARQVQAVFNGAKSRAARAGEPRGVRLLINGA
jgi:prepilin-type N-terminal cleavage/methylation domain-containing protein